MLFLFYNSFSQGRLGYFAGTGVVFYNGDINEKSSKIISPGKVFKPFFRVGINYRLTKRMEASLGFFYGNIGGADSLASEIDNRTRNLSFQSVIEELSLHLEYHLFSVYRERRFNPFIFAGGGIFHFNPVTEMDGIKYELQPLGTEGQNIPDGGYATPYSLTQFCIPIGVGFYFQINQHWRVKIHYTNHFTFTDYLDDASTVYPDSSSLAQTPYGQLAVSLSNRRLKGKFPLDKTERANRSLNDSYSDIGITIIYNPGELTGGNVTGAGGFKHRNKNKLNKKNLCPAYN
ncbi:MAG: DUF6089 family protein [Bacteroidota bacterium]